jgi:SAM-dependent methyltransferase
VSVTSDGLTFPGVHPSPNIRDAPDVYELENDAADPERRIEAAMRPIACWDDKVVLDLGAGTGYHIARFHETARHVIAVEPHGPSRLRAMARVAAQGLKNVSIMTGSAERLLLPEASIDVVHARFAYFVAPTCEPGLRELKRVIRPGGAAFVIDNDLRGGTFVSWLRRVPMHRAIDPDVADAFWTTHGFAGTTVQSEWRFKRRAELEAVVRVEFPGEVADGILAEHQDLRVAYWYRVYHRRY